MRHEYEPSTISFRNREKELIASGYHVVSQTLRTTTFVNEDDKVRLHYKLYEK